MVVNLDKFQSIIINRLAKLNNSYELIIDNHEIDLENAVTLLGIQKDDKLNFKKHAAALCQKAGLQLIVLPRIHKYIGFQEVKMLLDSFIFLNFNYRPLVWHFCSAALSQKKEKMQEHVLRLLYNDSYSCYNNLRLKTERPTMEVSRLRRLAVKVFKTLKSLNPDFLFSIQF